MPDKRETRPTIQPLGELYQDLLMVDSTINSRSLAQQATSLLCSKLQERESRIKERVHELARKRGMTFEALWDMILVGKFQKLEPEDYEPIVEERYGESS